MAGRDPFGTLADLRRLFPDLHPELELDEIPGADHFFEGATVELKDRVRDYALRVAEARR
jgi:hypothetical protein